MQGVVSRQLVSSGLGVKLRSDAMPRVRQRCIMNRYILAASGCQGRSPPPLTHSPPKDAAQPKIVLDFGKWIFGMLSISGVHTAHLLEWGTQQRFSSKLEQQQ
jgi:hypothetical protein